MSAGTCWEVVGGGDKGGILVRVGKDLASEQVAERLSTGALVKELALEGERLQFQRLTGTGPAIGWVSLKLKGKDLVSKSDKALTLGELRIVGLGGEELMVLRDVDATSTVRSIRRGLEEKARADGQNISYQLTLSDKVIDEWLTLLALPLEPVATIQAIVVEKNKYTLRWAVNMDEWTPLGEADGEEFQFVLSLIEPEAERTAVMRYKFFEDKKRALLSRLMMRASSACVMNRTSFKDISVKRTKGKKPFLSAPLPPEDEAPNFNVNPSHEGSWVVCASEPLCVCGIDVAELRRENKKGEPIDFYKSFKDQLTEHEWADVRSTGGSLDDQYEVFSRYWAAKEAFTKARGDGLAYPFNEVEFHWTPLEGFPPKTAYQGTVKEKGKVSSLWRLVQHRLPTTKPHWVTVARGPLDEIVDAQGEFTQTLRKKQSSFATQDWQAALHADSPVFEILPFAELVPPDAREDYEKAIARGKEKR